MPDRSSTMTVAGQEFKVSSPGRVLYPATGTTKAEVIAYYVQVADVVLPHLAGRPATRKRWPDGVDGPEFFAKDLEVGSPPWLTRVQIRHTSGPKFYPVMTSAAALGGWGRSPRWSCMCRSGASKPRRPPRRRRRRCATRTGWCSIWTRARAPALPNACRWRCTCGNGSAPSANA